MYATKRKLHNLLQAATGSSSTPTQPSANKGDKTPSKFSTVFRSKSTVNLPRNHVETSSDTHSSTLAPAEQEPKRPTTAGATIAGDSVSTNITATSNTIRLVSNEEGPTATPHSTATTSASPDPKKRRTGVPDSTRWSIRSTNTSSSSTTDFSIPSITTTTTTTTVSEKPTPAYAPWDRPQFLTRLKTYRFVDKWTPKPAAVNEVVWAKRGWVCVDKNRVRCTVCSREVVVKIEADETMDEDTEMGEVDNMEALEKERSRREARRRMQKGLVDRYRGMVVTEHESYCLWRRKGCDDTIYHLPLANPAHSIPALRTRYQSLISIKNDLPAAIDYPSNFIDLSRIRHAFPQLLQEPHNSEGSGAEVVEGAFILALFGWANEEPSIPTLLTCSACFRRLGLWLFKNLKSAGEVEVNQGSVNGNGEPPTMSRLDVVGEHRDYCPWVCKESQGKEPGWKTLWKIVGLQVGTMGSRQVEFAHSPSSDGSGNAANHMRGKSQDSQLFHLQKQQQQAESQVGVLGLSMSPPPLSEKERDEQTNKLESRLKRLKTVYFGGGKKKEKDGRARASSLVVGLGRNTGSPGGDGGVGTTPQ